MRGRGDSMSASYRLSSLVFALRTSAVDAGAEEVVSRG